MAKVNPNPPSAYEKLTGKRTSDIRLPTEGARDPRLPAPTRLGAIRDNVDRARAATRSLSKGRR